MIHLGLEHQWFPSAQAALEYVIIKATDASSSWERPTVLAWRDPTITFTLAQAGTTRYRWNKLVSDYLDHSIMDLERPSKRGDTHSFHPKTNNHDRGNCFIGLTTASRPYRVTMFSRRTRLVPVGILDAQIICAVQRRLDLEWGVWYIDSFFVEKHTLIPPLVAMGWTPERILATMPGRTREQCAAIFEGVNMSGRASITRVIKAMSTVGSPAVSTLDLSHLTGGP